MFQPLSLQPCWFALWQWRAEIWLVYDVFDSCYTFDTLATHSSLVHDVTDTEGLCIWHSSYTFQPCSWRHWHRGFMMYLTLLLHIPALFVMSLTQRVHDIFDTLATHSSLVCDVSGTEGSWRIWHSCYTFQPCSTRHWHRGFMTYLTFLLHIPALFETSLTQRVHDVFDILATHSSLVRDVSDTEGSWRIDTLATHSSLVRDVSDTEGSWRIDTLATHSSLVRDVSDTEGSWHIWHSCYTFQPCSWRLWHRGFMTYLTLLLHIPALFVTSLTLSTGGLKMAALMVMFVGLSKVDF